MRKPSLLFLITVLPLIGVDVLRATALAEESTVKAQPLVLELNIFCGIPVRQEVLLGDQREFHVITWVDNKKFVVKGKVESVTEKRATVDLHVHVFFGANSSVNLSRKVELTIGQLDGGGFGPIPNVGYVENIWIRRGLNPVPNLIRQLSSQPNRAVVAATYLQELGADAEAALPALRIAATAKESRLKVAARNAIASIVGDLPRKRQ